MDVGVVGCALVEKTVQIVRDVAKDLRFDSLVDGLGCSRPHNAVAYPILLGGRVVAVTVVVNKLTGGEARGEAFGASDVAAIQDLSDLCGLPLSHAKMSKGRDSDESSLSDSDEA